MNVLQAKPRRRLKKYAEAKRSQEPESEKKKGEHENVKERGLAE
jgi:hypothetical protein